MACPLTLVMMSPGFKPARSPGLFGSTALTNAPCGVAMPKDCESGWLMSWTATPMRLRFTLPFFRSWSFTFSATSMGMAKDMPM